MRLLAAFDALGGVTRGHCALDHSAIIRAMPPIRVATLPHFHAIGDQASLALPAYASDGAAGLDVQAAVAQPVELLPGARAAFPTGLMLAIPPGFEVQVRPRSGLALKHGVTVLNSPGTIDSDYRGEVQVVLVNLGADPVLVSRGMRIAQLVVARVERGEWVPVDSLDRTRRGDGGFGSTGWGGAGQPLPAGSTVSDSDRG